MSDARAIEPRPGARLPGWEASLAEYLRLARKWRFAWGAHDCCMHAAAVVKLQCGRDLAAAIRWTYRDAAGARAMLRKNYGGAVWRVPEAHGLQPVEVRRAQRGNIVGAPIGHRRALGVCFGTKSYFVGATGLVALATLDCEKAWRIA